MRIMHDHQIFGMQEFGGVSRYHMELITELNKLPDNCAEASVAFSVNEYLHEYLGRRRLKHTSNRYYRRIRYIIINFINEVYCRIEAQKYDVIHVTWVSPYLGSKYNDKLVVTIHDMIHEKFLSDNPYVQDEIKNKRHMIYAAKEIIAISENTKKDILHFYPDVDENKITVIYHGTNFLPAPQTPKTALPERYILYVGRRDSYKGANVLLDAFAKMEKNDDIKLVFVSDIAFSEAEKAKHKELGVEDKVSLVSATDAELAYIYEHAICFVYPSLYEGFGFPLLEAFNCNCPVICTNSSSLPEVGGEAALYFEPEDTRGLMEQMNRVINNADLRNDLIAKGKNRAKGFSWEKCARETYEVYKKI